MIGETAADCSRLQPRRNTAYRLSGNIYGGLFMMKSRIWKKTAAALLAAVILVTVAGCGTDDPESQVAKVNATVITTAPFDNYLMLCP